jgi:hypothetical protein
VDQKTSASKTTSVSIASASTRVTETFAAAPSMSSQLAYAGYSPTRADALLAKTSESRPIPNPGPSPQFRLPNSGPSNGIPPTQMLKRATSQTPLVEEPSAKKQKRWSQEEDDLIIKLRGRGMKWDDIAKTLPERTRISCRLRHQNYLEKLDLNEKKKDKLACLYARYVNPFSHTSVRDSAAWAVSDPVCQ